ncbi:hypothetical protein V498_07276 [Pseudogymnoascus sp. VKM F-4517 (FW-2822)]|nr:hypothetical protein V498_07276 [Pseudogymnoascus sp. VKM F-4517 (FW-2822)]
MEFASGGSASSHESNSLKARYPLSATVCPLRRRLQRSFFAAGPHKIASPIGVNQEGDTGQYSTLGSRVRNVVQYEEYVLHEVVLAAPLSYKPPGHTRVASALVSFVFTVMYRTSFTLWPWGKLDAGGKIQLTYILGQILSGWFTKSGLQVASPPRDTSMGQGRDDGDGGLVIFAATGREERWAIWGTSRIKYVRMVPLTSKVPKTAQHYMPQSITQRGASVPVRNEFGNGQDDDCAWRDQPSLAQVLCVFGLSRDNRSRRQPPLCLDGATTKIPASDDVS